MVYTLDTVTTLLKSYLALTAMDSKNNENGIGDITPVDNQRGFLDYSARDMDSLWTGLILDTFSLTLQTDTIAKVDAFLAKLDLMSQQYRTGAATSGTLNLKVSATTTQMRTAATWTNKGIELWESGLIFPWIEDTPPVTITAIGGINCITTSYPNGLGPGVHDGHRVLNVGNAGTIEIHMRQHQIALNQYGGFRLYSDLGHYLISLFFEPGGNLWWNEHATGVPYVMDQWYRVTINYDNVAFTHEVLIDGVSLGAAIPFAQPEPITSIRIFAQEVP